MTTLALADVVGNLLAVPREIRVTDVTCDSREVRPGGAFLACRGRTTHGLAFAREAVARGARVVLWEPDRDTRAPDLGPGVFATPVPDLTRRAGELADRFFGMPSLALTIAGITGTNGKTTCAYLLAQALTIAGRRAGYIGTLGFGQPGALAQGTHTTADAVSVHRQLAQLRADGAACVAMEVSSHALDQSRVGGVRFHTAAFTNLTRDHLDYHGTMEAYAAAKAKLFDWPGLASRVVNVDDAFGRELTRRAGDGRLIVTAQREALAGLARAPDGHVLARAVTPVARGLAIEVDSSWGRMALEMPLIGRFNAENALTVLAMLLEWGVPPAEACAALARCHAPPGRMEAFGVRGGTVLAVVDYAHSPDALAKALDAARAHCRGALWIVFGCGGDRDAGKRPLMGRIAAERADRLIVTDDNPRTEDPRHIVAQILEGVRQAANAGATPAAAPAAARTRMIHDRAVAIRTALAEAREGDVVLIAGKGHEQYQICGREARPFSDQAIVREAVGTST